MTIPEHAARIAALRERCLDRKGLPRFDPAVAMARSLEESAHEPSWQRRAGMRCRDILAAARMEIDDLEWLAGRLAPDDADPAERDRARRWVAENHPRAPGQTGHCELDRARLFALGVDGLRREIRRRGEAAGRAGDVDGEDACFSFDLALEGLSLFCREGARAARHAMRAASPERLKELEAIAESCERIAHYPPESFRDAVQLAWLMDMAAMLGDGISLAVPGRLDRTLLPYYEADIASSALAPEEALLTLESLYLLVNEYVPDGLAMSVMVGGRDAQGRDTTNALSYLCLEALRRTRLVYPTIGVCWHEQTPAELSRLAVELIAEGLATPAFFCDDTIQRGLRRYGVAPEDSHWYINSTCVEITPSTMSNVWVASPYFPMCALLNDEIAKQAENDAAANFETFVQRYHARVAERIAQGAAHQAELRKRWCLRGRKPLQSVFTRDCIDRARDIDDGGARVNWVECSFVGLANLADSLEVIRREVYETGRLDMAGLQAVLQADYEGHEAERLRFASAHPKYGNDCDAVDGYVARTVEFCIAECARHKMPPDDAHFVPGAFCWVMHERMGRETGATPDGRRAGEPFADGAGPAQGREARGPTCAILSTTSWDHSPLIGGVAFNMKFNRSLLGAQGACDRLQQLIETYMRRGGFETQVNVVDRATLEKALSRPEAYRDLVVRIGGYTDYFTRLSPEMQEEVIRRTEFADW